MDSIIEEIKQRYSDFYIGEFTWRDEGPEPFAGDFMAGSLDDYDSFLVLANPKCSQESLGIQIQSFPFLFWEENAFSVYYPIDWSYHSKHMTNENQMYELVDSITSKWI